ncbi:MAG: hypothetical protein U0271_32475 [Polyangiaceae bacterium]
MRRKSLLVHSSARWALSLGALAGVAPFVVASCTTDDTNVTVRSLESAGHVAFVCLGEPGDATSLRPLTDCTNERLEDLQDFGDDGSTPHLYALVTLETRGEVAVIDLTSKSGNVLDQDPSQPGASPLPVGGRPVDIVATPKGTAAFVASADRSAPGLYAMPAESLRPCSVEDSDCSQAAPTLSSWPSCRLPSAPGEMVLIADPEVAGQVRPSCDSGYQDVDASAPAFGDIDREGLGRQKLYVTLPDVGQIVVVDAQSLLDSSPGAFADCTIERTITLTSVPPAIAPEPPIEPGPACAVPRTVEPNPAGNYVATPTSLALAAAGGDDGARLFAGDLTAPLIHVLDLSDVCEPLEVEPLAPSSVADPTREVFVSQIAVTTVTPSQHRYLFGIDVEDRSVMTFDVTVGASDPQPLRVAKPALNPFQPPDRVRFAAAPVDVSVMTRDNPKSTASEVAPFGTLCDPNPNAVVCSSDSTSCDLGTFYRTSSDFEAGAGPYTLRGVYGLVALASGQIGIIDVEDFDAPCRGPVTKSTSLGCDEDGSTELVTSGEPSCNIVAPLEPRSGNYLLTNDDVGRHEPGIQSFPVLSLDDGTVVTDGPVMRAPIATSGAAFHLPVGGEVFDVDPGTGTISDDEGARNTLLMVLEDPRVHQIDQSWTLTYQGMLPGFDNRVGDLDLASGTFRDASAAFCGRGVQSRAAVHAELEAAGVTGNDLESQASRYADRLVVTENLPASDDPYWDTVSCSFQSCRTTFGDGTNTTQNRDLVIVEAYEDHLELASSSDTDIESFECCFPTLVDYEIRSGDEWVLVGTSSGFQHAVIADPETGVCRPSCDPRVARMKSRARYTIGPTESTVVSSTDALAFSNALFRFGIVVPENADKPVLARDMAFHFVTQSSFEPLRAVLTSSDRTYVQIKQMGYVENTDEFFATDGALEGLILFPGDFGGDIRQYY